MRKCNCLRYEALRANRRDESMYVYRDDGLYPIEAIYPLEDFEPASGKLITICPLYNYLHEGKLIARAYDKLVDRELPTEDKDIIMEAVSKCENCIEVKKFLIFSERNKEILELFCEEYKVRMTWRLLNEYLAFLKVRKDYKDDNLCKDIPADEKKKCFDQLWIKSFVEYLKNAKFTLP
jgi:hypothetical protein